MMSHPKITEVLRIASFVMVLALGGLAMASSAFANSYALSYDNVYNLVISASGGASFSLSPPATVDNSEASATLNGANAHTGGTGFTDAPPAQIGSSKADNDFTAVGATGTAYSRADSQIVSQQLLGAPNTQAINIAESNIPSTG